MTLNTYRASIKSAIVAVAATMLILMSCSGPKDRGLITVTADMNAVTDIPVSEGRLIPLDNSDSCALLDNVINIEMDKDRFYVLTRKSVKSFDNGDGRYLTTYGSIGQGPGEYTSIKQMWLEDGILYIYDFNTNIAHSFKPDGSTIASTKEYYDRKTPGMGPTSKFPYPDNSCYIMLNTYTDGTTDTNPLASVHDKDMNRIKPVEGRNVPGGNLDNQVAADPANNRLLYWEALKDTIFAITTDTIKPAYAVDFGKLRFPDQDNNNVFEKMYTFSNAIKSGAEYATLIQNVQKWDNLVFFVFTTGKSRFFIGVIDEDKDTDNMKIYRIDDPRYTQKALIKIFGDNLYVLLNDEEDEDANPALLVIPANKFK